MTRYTNEQVYGPIPISDEEFDTILDKSLAPRNAAMLYTKMGVMGLGANHTVLDIGCRDLRHGLQLVERYGCTIVGVDPLAYHIQLATEQVEDIGLARQASAKSGTIEQIPSNDECFDYIFCRDMLNHVSNLEAAFRECARVLKLGGQMLIYITLATDELTEKEASQLYPALGIHANAMNPANVEKAITAAKLQITEMDQIGSEWREQWEEDGTRITSHQLLRIARMLRNRDTYVEKLGLVPYETELANCRWGVCQMLGKLCPTMYILQKT